VSINFLEKIAMPHIYAIFGAMLANVDYITMGAGVPRHVPDVIDAFCENRVAEYPIPVIDSKDPWVMKFDPTEIFGNQIPSLKKPGFIPIVASNTLASYFAKKFAGRIYGLAIEEPTAGGHNAPPRNKETGQYSDVDKVDYAKVAELGLPFWIGGSYAYPEKLREALSVGASGIQVGSIFALSNESGMDQVLKSSLRKAGYVGVLQVEADMRISPTGYPFEVAQVQGTMSDERVRSIMVRKCPHGALVDLVLGPNGIIVRRCASEPIDQFIRKGGMIEDTEGRGCICRGLVGTSGLGNPDEIPVVTLGKDLGFLKRLMNRPDDSYTAKDAINFLLGKK